MSEKGSGDGEWAGKGRNGKAGVRDGREGERDPEREIKTTHVCEGESVTKGEW